MPFSETISTDGTISTCELPDTVATTDFPVEATTSQQQSSTPSIVNYLDLDDKSTDSLSADVSCKKCPKKNIIIRRLIILSKKNSQSVETINLLKL